MKPSLADGLVGAALVLAAAQGPAPRPRPIPADTLPRPLVRAAPLGAEELARGWTAGDSEVALGRRLFFDPLLSRDRTLACASCHRPDHGFADDRPFSLGIDGQSTTRNSPSLLNKALSEQVAWDGRAASIEEQVLLPIANPIEMGLDVEGAIERLGRDESYRAEFDRAYGARPDRGNLARALAAFVRALAVADSPVDRFRAGDPRALSFEERAGMWIYEGRGGCWRCHRGPNFSDESFHNTGVGAVDGRPQAGRGAITGEARDRGKFRTPGLRRLTETAPYMHDGSLGTLEEVVEFYRRGGGANSNLSSRLRPLELSDEDAAHLVAFLRALSR